MAREKIEGLISTLHERLGAADDGEILARFQHGPRSAEFQAVDIGQVVELVIDDFVIARRIIDEILLVRRCGSRRRCGARTGQ